MSDDISSSVNADQPRHGAFFPLPDRELLRNAFVGKSLREAPVPAAVLDVSRIKHSCRLMLNAVAELQLGFRAHVKTHKTCEVMQLQVGEDSKDVRLIVSTVIEAESLVSTLKEYQHRGAKVNVLYGIPLGSSKVARLAAVAKELGPGSVSVMVDNVGQLISVRQFKQEAGSPVSIFIKTDSGYHRAGLLPDSDTMVELVKAVAQAEAQGDLHLLGFYGHNSLSYGGDNPDDAMKMLTLEIDTCRQAAAHISAITGKSRAAPLVISVGASPTALSIQNVQPSSKSSATTSAANQLIQIINKTNTTTSPAATPFTLEIHAGVYPIFDLQQVAASSRVFSSDLAAYQTQALTIVVEVVSTYPSRTSTPEALISAGTIALAKEACKSYPGWGVVTGWNMAHNAGYSDSTAIDSSKRIIVKRVSQEHGVIGWEDETRTEALPVSVGDKIRLWINHACITSVGYGWYLIVDESESSHDADVRVKDVWVRWRGW